ncbi:dTDP-4-amino-4,6-dideoxygalactose transaminase [Succinivibrio dextrinosolvens DSM 3072]|uniref:dTDP-4-amino-4,6-dideoxygalactose transaminase n=1 Tax=Succinivibrio dextrinosolvens DSM 3072 TaxID=1123324 RepID=A0A1T4VBN4_9GAMM|nr:dTDP-4-amino-4,6-dideoxygalactose transaminase [Succinivibrio dextrinosolvens]SKA62364.1 dTDP-4-amino-4,6-dideoxygalactose transaminase [Succinivibrio dextrinosolvens DSM 3072]
MIDFNIPPFVGTEFKYINDAINNKKICGDGFFTKKCNNWIENKFNANKALLTTSGSSALDIAAYLCDLNPGDEIILPSYTFSSTANSFVLAGGGQWSPNLVFVDIRKDTMNIDESKIEYAITNKTKAIVVVHYAGVSCNMDKIMDIAKKYNLIVVEDAAQGFMSTYNGRALGTIGDFGCYSFHETKNYSMGEGGAIVINNDKFVEKAEILREKGTNRNQFFRGVVDKYTWVNFGDSYLPSDINAAYLYSQLECADIINSNRLETWNCYYDAFHDYVQEGKFEIPFIPNDCKHNAHMFYIKFENLSIRQNFISYMKSNNIQCAFHYIPLHSSPAGIKYGRFSGIDVNTTIESERLVRLPMYFNMKKEDVQQVINRTLDFLKMTI